MRKLGGGGVIYEIRKTRRDFGKREFSFGHVGFEVLVVCPERCPSGNSVYRSNFWDTGLGLEIKNLECIHLSATVKSQGNG